MNLKKKTLIFQKMGVIPRFETIYDVIQEINYVFKLIYYVLNKFFRFERCEFFAGGGFRKQWYHPALACPIKPGRVFWDEMCHSQKSRFFLDKLIPPLIGILNPYNGYINPYYWVDEFIPYYMVIMGV